MYFDSDVEFDSEGNANNWWSHDVKKRFDNRSECLVKQYSSVYDEEAEVDVSLKIFFLIYIFDNE